MTFTYEGADLSKIIKKYFKNGNNYTIQYLDGTNFDYCSLASNEEQNIKCNMIKQAIERQVNISTKSISTINYVSLLNSILSAIGTSIGIKNNKEILSIILFILLPFSLYNYKKSSSKLNELKKYRMFLELIDDLDKINNSQFLKCIEFDNYYQKQFDINTLDEYSYRDVKTIYKKFKEISKK